MLDMQRAAAAGLVLRNQHAWQWEACRQGNGALTRLLHLLRVVALLDGLGDQIGDLTHLIGCQSRA